MTKYNVDLMLAVREQITSHPETHDQDSWGRRGPECGTTHCIAGWAAVLSGRSLEWNEGGYANTTEGVDVGRAAEVLLGLNGNEAWALFHSLDNSDALAKLDELIEKGKNQP